MEFIREQIKDKPINKKKILQKVGVAALCGATFALAACFVVMLCLPFIREAMAPVDTQETEETQTIDEKDSSGDDSQEDSEQESGGGEVQPPIPDYDPTLEDYQKLQNQLYEIGREANHSIVTVTRVVSETDWTDNSYETKGQGSGVIISEDADYLYVLTEKKVISDASRIKVSFVDGAGAEATLLSSDKNTGVAVLTVEKRQLDETTQAAVQVAVMGNSNLVSNGTIVIALGSPLGTNYSILTGNITSTNNDVATLDKNYSVFTTDIVASEKGSGILINTKGEVVGMVIQAFSGSQDASTLTAVGITEISGIVESLKNGKDIPHIGLYISTVTKDISEMYDIPKGVFIKEVLIDSPAMFAGLQSGDVITHINGEAVSTDISYSNKIQNLIPGTTCEFTVRRQSGNGYYEIRCEVEIGTLK